MASYTTNEKPPRLTDLEPQLIDMYELEHDEALHASMMARQPGIMEPGVALSGVQAAWWGITSVTVDGGYGGGTRAVV